MMFTMDEAGVNQASIKVIGVGGGGCNAVNRMLEMDLMGIDFLIANTDVQALLRSTAPFQIQLGANLTRGLGAGGNPDIGREAALEEEDVIREALRDADLVFITAGMGGGTGTGAAPIIARVAKELGALTIAVVTKPFVFEGRIRLDNADKGIRNLQESVDTLIAIPNQKLLTIAEQSTSLLDSFRLANDVLGQAVQGISDLITVPGFINLDFADLKTIMSATGKALMGTGCAQGDNRAVDAVQTAIHSPLLDDIRLNGARRILVNITGGNDLTLMETSHVMEMISEAADPSANIIFGTAIDSRFDKAMKVTVIATCFDKSDPRPKFHSPRDASTPTTMANPEGQAVAQAAAGHMPGPLKSSAIPDKKPTSGSRQRKMDLENTDTQIPMPDEAETATKPAPFLQPELQMEARSTNSMTQTIPAETSDPGSAEPDVEDTPNIEILDHYRESPAYERLPGYKPRKLGQGGAYRDHKKLDAERVNIETSNYMIPAFLRRKAD